MARWEADEDGIRAFMQSEQVRAFAEGLANAHALKAKAGMPLSDKAFKMPDFCVRSYTNEGSRQHETAIAIVVATNPRSHWYAINKGVLDF